MARVLPGRLISQFTRVINAVVGSHNTAARALPRGGIARATRPLIIPPKLMTITRGVTTMFSTTL